MEMEALSPATWLRSTAIADPPLPALGFTSNGWQPPEDFTPGDWFNCVRAVIRVKDSSYRWWLGDLYCWPPDDDLLATLRAATEADDWIGPKWGTFQSYGSVAKAFPTMTWVKAVSFKHHRVVMALPPDERTNLLQWAAKNKVSVRGLETEMKRRSFAVVETITEPIAEANELVDFVKAVLADQSPAQVIDGAELELKRLAHTFQDYLSAWSKASGHARCEFALSHLDALVAHTAEVKMATTD